MKPHNDPLGRREFLTRATQAGVAVAASLGMGAPVAPRLARAGEDRASRASRISYYCNGEIHVNEVGKPEGKPVTTGHWDFKPSWSKTGDMLVCFRRLQDDPDVMKWKSAIFVVNVGSSAGADCWNCRNNSSIDWASASESGAGLLPMISADH
jgi:hypothetical protein